MGAQGLWPSHAKDHHHQAMLTQRPDNDAEDHLISRCEMPLRGRAPGRSRCMPPSNLSPVSRRRPYDSAAPVVDAQPSLLECLLRRATCRWGATGATQGEKPLLDCVPTLRSMSHSCPVIDKVIAQTQRNCVVVPMVWYVGYGIYHTSGHPNPRLDTVA